MEHLSTEQIAQCADAIVYGKYGELDIDLRNHLANCDECAAEVLSVTDIVFDYNLEKSDKGKVLNMKRWIAVVSGVAAAITVVFLVTSVFFNSKFKSDYIVSDDSIKVKSTEITNNEVKIDARGDVVENNQTITTAADKNENSSLSKVEPEHKVKQKVKIKSKTPSDQQTSFSGLYVPDQTLEILFENFTQAYRGADIVVLSTGITQVPENDSLKWSNPNKDELYVEFFDNKGTRFLTTTEYSSGIKLPELEDGLYYWKLVNQDFDLLFVGKIVVEK